MHIISASTNIKRYDVLTPIATSKDVINWNINNKDRRAGIN